MNPANLPDVKLSLEFVNHFVVESIAALCHRTPAERTRVIDAHQED